MQVVTQVFVSGLNSIDRSLLVFLIRRLSWVMRRRVDATLLMLIVKQRWLTLFSYLLEHLLWRGTQEFTLLCLQLFLVEVPHLFEDSADLHEHELLLVAGLSCYPAYAVSLVDCPILMYERVQWYDGICLKKVLLEPSSWRLFISSGQAESNSFFEEGLAFVWRPLSFKPRIELQTGWAPLVLMQGDRSISRQADCLWRDARRALVTCFTKLKVIGTHSVNGGQGGRK